MNKLDLTKPGMMPVFVGRMVATHKARKTGCQLGKSECWNTYDDGTHCIVGAGMPDDFANNNKRGMFASFIDDGRIVMPRKYISRVEALQHYHDSAARGEFRKENMKKLKDSLRKLAITIRKDYGYAADAVLPTEYPTQA